MPQPVTTQPVTTQPAEPPSLQDTYWYMKDKLKEIKAFSYGLTDQRAAKWLENQVCDIQKGLNRIGDVVAPTGS